MFIYFKCVYQVILLRLFGFARKEGVPRVFFRPRPCVNMGAFGWNWSVLDCVERDDGWQSLSLTVLL